MVGVVDNYELVLQDMLARLARLNYAIVGDRTGAVFDIDSESLEIPFFGQKIIVSKTSCGALDNAACNPKDAIMIIDYLLSFGGFEPGSDWIDFRDLPGSMPYDTAFRAHVESQLEEHASEIIEHQNILMDKFAGQVLGGFESYDFSAAFRVFPRLECLVLLCEGEDGLRAGAKVLFSSNASCFMTTESLAAIAESLTARLVLNSCTGR
jgi:hypothetical protein